MYWRWSIKSLTTPCNGRSLICLTVADQGGVWHGFAGNDSVKGGRCKDSWSCGSIFGDMRKLVSGPRESVKATGAVSYRSVMSKGLFFESCCSCKANKIASSYDRLCRLVLSRWLPPGSVPVTERFTPRLCQKAYNFLASLRSSDAFGSSFGDSSSGRLCQHSCKHLGACRRTSSVGARSLNVENSIKVFAVQVESNSDILPPRMHSVLRDAILSVFNKPLESFHENIAGINGNLVVIGVHFSNHMFGINLGIAR
ncbi:uncharacterized protein BYT42DRAFT_333238 [Radiomyces spectabilis]|uniref:uncharacterized protein n=1 Tax=Radiomyces spectabilis TaxID=64574 RepID=UPI00221F625E|nr:uncharacterized protein BYT42DRAFT_333238 [Radiomyces spectabilis]KAI8379609.1 hypothetical protein BYT42DRAFT_333238 [Radiomyces spectabilis]